MDTDKAERNGLLQRMARRQHRANLTLGVLVGLEICLMAVGLVVTRGGTAIGRSATDTTLEARNGDSGTAGGLNTSDDEASGKKDKARKPRPVPIDPETGMPATSTQAKQAGDSGDRIYNPIEEVFTEHGSRNPKKTGRKM